MDEDDLRVSLVRTFHPRFASGTGNCSCVVCCVFGCGVCFVFVVGCWVAASIARSPRFLLV